MGTNLVVVGRWGHVLGCAVLALSLSACQADRRTGARIEATTTTEDELLAHAEGDMSHSELALRSTVLPEIERRSIRENRVAAIEFSGDREIYVVRFVGEPTAEDVEKFSDIPQVVVEGGARFNKTDQRDISPMVAKHLRAAELEYWSVVTNAYSIEITLRVEGDPARLRGLPSEIANDALADEAIEAVRKFMPHLEIADFKVLQRPGRIG